MQKFTIEQKLIPSAYPSMNIMSKVIMYSNNDNESNTIYIRRNIKNWKAYTKDAVKPIICYTLGFIKCIYNNIYKSIPDPDRDPSNKPLYGFIIDTEKNNKQIFILEYHICETTQDAENMRRYLAATNLVNADKCWIFEYGSDYNSNVDKLINEDTIFVIDIEENPIKVLSKDPIPETDSFTCFITEAKKNNKENGEN